MEFYLFHKLPFSIELKIKILSYIFLDNLVNISGPLFPVIQRLWSGTCKLVNI